MTKTKKCHIERSRNAFEYDISNVFDRAQIDIRYIINFCHVLRFLIKKKLTTLYLAV